MYTYIIFLKLFSIIGFYKILTIVLFLLFNERHFWVWWVKGISNGPIYLDPSQSFFFLAISLSMWDLSSPTRDQTHIPCIGNMSLIHWTIREVPRTIFLKLRSDSSTPQFKAGQWFLLLSRTKSQTLKYTLVLASTRLFSHLCPTT